MTIVKHFLLALLLSSFLSGCVYFTKPEPVVKIKYVKEDKYEFNIIDSKNLAIDAESKEKQRMCTELVLQVGYQYRGVIDYYEEQINDYRSKK